MPINFASLPTNSPNTIPPKGAYYATIDKAEMKAPKDATKPPYLSLTYSIQNAEGKGQGKIFDILSESDHELVRYKLQRFITALDIPITGSFELKDLAKIVQGKKFIVDITKEEKEGQPARAVVDIFSNQIYYSMAEAATIFAGDFENPDDELGDFNAADAADATPTPTDQTGADKY